MPALETVLAELTAALEPARDVQGACQTTIDVLVGCGFALTSIYLERGDRLRCLGVRGYGQIYDGIPSGVGVIGATVASGRAAQVVTTDGQSEYRQAAGGVVEELCFPLTVDGRCIGALNVEGLTRLRPDAVPLLAAAAAVLSTQLERLGGLPPESRSQRLVRYATDLAAAGTLTELSQTLLEAAIAISGCSSACLVVGRWPRVLAARGESAELLSALSSRDLELLLPWVDTGGSSRTSGEPAALASPAQEVLLRAGLATFVLVPISAGGESLGMLVAGGGVARAIHPDTVESVELLAALAAADFRSLRATNKLRHQARTDDLTGLPHRRAFTEALDLALLGDSRVRPRRQLAVLLMDLDGFKTVNDTRGHPAGDELLCQIARLLSTALRSTDTLYRLGGDEFATLLEVDDVSEVRGTAERLLAAARTSGTTVSIGAALVRDDEQPREAVASADRQLYAAKRGGRDRSHVRE